MSAASKDSKEEDITLELCEACLNGGTRFDCHWKEHISAVLEKGCEMAWSFCPMGHKYREDFELLRKDLAEYFTDEYHLDLGFLHPEDKYTLNKCVMNAIEDTFSDDMRECQFGDHNKKKYEILYGNSNEYNDSAKNDKKRKADETDSAEIEEKKIEVIEILDSDDE